MWQPHWVVPVCGPVGMHIIPVFMCSQRFTRNMEKCACIQRGLVIKATTLDPLQFNRSDRCQTNAQRANDSLCRSSLQQKNWNESAFQKAARHKLTVMLAPFSSHIDDICATALSLEQTLSMALSLSQAGRSFNRQCSTQSFLDQSKTIQMALAPAPKRTRNT